MNDDRPLPAPAEPPETPGPRWRMRCREASAVLLQAQEMPLRWRDRLRLRLHLAACDACVRFEGQLTLMRGAMDQWRRYRDAGASHFGNEAGSAGDDRAR